MGGQRDILLFICVEKGLYRHDAVGVCLQRSYPDPHRPGQGRVDNRSIRMEEGRTLSLNHHHSNVRLIENQKGHLLQYILLSIHSHLRIFFILLFW